MTAKELIEKLQMLDPDQEIYVEYAEYDDDDGCHFNLIGYFGLTEHGVLTNDAEDKWI